jgi:preprotein translocase SecE subunit
VWPCIGMDIAPIGYGHYDRERLNVANKMADKKKNVNPGLGTSTTRGQMVEPQATATAAVSTPSGSTKDQRKVAKTAASARQERKVQESKPAKRENKPAPNAAPAWQARLRKNRSIAFLIDAYNELRHKVTWPTFVEARNLTIVVVLLSAAVGLILGAVDYGLYQLFLLLAQK